MSGPYIVTLLYLLHIALRDFRRRRFAFDLQRSVQIDAHFAAIAHEDHMLPFPAGDFRFPREDARGVVACLKDELASVTAFAADAEVMTEGAQPVIMIAGEKPTAQLAALIRHAVPEP